MTTAYKVAHLTKVYRDQTMPANDNISLEIQQGEIFGLLGDRGAGKSTLVGQMTGLIPPTSGSIQLYGEEIGRTSGYVPRYVGYMPQTETTDSTLTLHQTLYYAAHLRGLSPTAARQERERLIALWGLDAIRYKFVSKLSGREARLALLVTALAGSPPILILDEPAQDLPPQQRRQLWQILLELNREQGTTILVITPDPHTAERLVQRVGIMQHGRLVAADRPAALKQMVDDQLRLELYFNPARPPTLPPYLIPAVQEQGRWLLYLPRAQVTAALEAIDLTQLEDFHLRSITLEELYLHYTKS